MKNAWSEDPTGVRPAATTAFIVDLLVRIGKKPQRQHSTVLALHYGTRSITAPLLPNTHARRSGPSGAGEDGAHRAQVVHPHLRLSRGYANWIPPERLLGVLNGVGAVLHVFQDVISGRGPVQDFSGLLAGETLIDRHAHPAAAASGVHLHE